MLGGGGEQTQANPCHDRPGGWSWCGGGGGSVRTAMKLRRLLPDQQGATSGRERTSGDGGGSVKLGGVIWPCFSSPSLPGPVAHQ